MVATLLKKNDVSDGATSGNSSLSIIWGTRCWEKCSPTLEWQGDSDLVRILLLTRRSRFLPFSPLSQFYEREKNIAKIKTRCLKFENQEESKVNLDRKKKVVQ